MSDDSDLYNKFNLDHSTKFNKFKSNVIVPFICSILGTGIVLGLAFGVPNIRNLLMTSNPENYSNTNSSKATQTPNSDINNNISLSHYSDTAIYAANKILPSIVGITVEYTITSNFIQGMSKLATAEGSGIIIDSKGYILTNNHIINSVDSSIFYEVSKATKVYVYLYHDETPYEAEIIGTDKKTDLAVIKIKKDNLTAAEIGDSNELKIGEFVMAIGNPLGMQSSVTSGIVSAVNRTVNGDDGNSYTLIQTDAAINAGNSGGALINSEGKVVGINTLKLSGTGIEGMGFAIPINDTINIYKQLIDSGKVLRPYIGIAGMDLDEITAKHYNLPVGVYVQEIQKNSPVSSADIKTGDIITGVDGKAINNMNELNKIKESKKIGDKITLDIYRNGEIKKVEIVLGEAP